MGGKASQAKQKEKKLMSQILADYLVKTHRVKIGKKEIDLTADQIIDKGISRAILSGSNATVGMIKEIREGTGDKGTQEATAHVKHLIILTRYGLQ